MFSPTNVKGLEFMHASTSWRLVSSSDLVHTDMPNVFFSADLMGLFNLSHQPPHHGALGAIFSQLGATEPNCPFSVFSAALKAGALSEKITETRPLRANILLNAKATSFAFNESTSSRCTALTTAQVISRMYNFFPGRSAQYRTPV